MKNEHLQQELELLLAERLISGFIDGEKCIEWAISLMERGYESDNLHILAGLDINDGMSIEHYFERLIDDLQLEQRRSENKLFCIYTSNIAHQVVDGKISPRKGLSVMEDIRIRTWNSDFSINLYQFTYLEEDILLLGEYQLFYNGLTKDNVDEVIIQEMKMFLFTQEKCLGDIKNLIYCNRCKSFSQIEYREVGWIIKKGDWYCKECRSKDFLAWNNIQDRKQILKILEIIV